MDSQLRAFPHSVIFRRWAPSRADQTYLLGGRPLGASIAWLDIQCQALAYLIRPLAIVSQATDM